MTIFTQWLRNIQPDIELAMPSVDHIFTPQRDAMLELMRRRKDLRLKRSVITNLTSGGREFRTRLERPSAILFRQIASPTQEVLRFLKIASHTGMQAIILEYHGDKFVSAGNPFKRALGKMPIYQQTASDGRDIVHYRTIVDFNSYVGKPLSTVRCTNGQSLVEFHHKLMKEIAGFDTNKYCIDATTWFHGNGGSANGYYEQFLSLFIRDAILFEYIEPTISEQTFARDVFIPAFRRVEAVFGLRPLIAELIPKNKSGRIFWDSYPKEIQKLLPA